MKRVLLAGVAMGIFAINLPGVAFAEGGHPEESAPVSWHISAVAGKRTFVIETQPFAFCGGPMPWLEPTVTEGRGEATIAAYFHSPAVPEGPTPVHITCTAALLKLTAKVQLRQSTCDLALFDGSTDPPAPRALPSLDPYCRTATYWQRCEGPERLEVHGMNCPAGRKVLHRYYSAEEVFAPSPSPPGYACAQHFSGRIAKREGEDPLQVNCRGIAKLNRGQRLRYITGDGPWPAGSTR